MRDIKLTWDVPRSRAMVSLAGNDLATDEGLETAVILSLFTDRRAHPDDPLPGDPTDLRGWWGDSYPEVEGDLIGSRLWLLAREKALQSVLNRAQEYAQEALQWMVDDGVADSVSAVAQAAPPNFLALAVSIQRPGLPAAQFRYQAAWSATYAVL